MIPYRRHWEQSRNSIVLAGTSQFTNLPEQQRVRPQAFRLHSLVGQVSIPTPACPAKPPSRQCHDSTPGRFKVLAPLVIAIVPEVDTRTHSMKLREIGASDGWVHLKVSPRDARRTDALVKCLDFVSMTAAFRGVGARQIYLFGMGAGAELALRLLALQPEQFGGVGVFEGSHPDLKGLFAPGVRLPHRAFLAASTGTSNLCRMLELGRLLHAIGMDVTTRLCTGRTLEPRLSNTRLREFVEWTQQSSR